MNSATESRANEKVRRRKRSVDLTEAFGFPFGDKDWLVNLLIHGLLMLIPILGSMIVMGWQRQAVAMIKAGEKGLPAIDVGKSIREGVAPFVAILNAVIPMAIFSSVLVVIAIGSLIGSIIIAEETNEEMIVVFGILIALFSYGGILVAAIVMMVIMPEFRRRGFRGEMFPLLSPGVSIAAWKAQPVGYLIVCVGFVLTSLLGGIGVYLCYVGMLFTMPWAHGANASLLAQFDLLLDDEDTNSSNSQSSGAVDEPPNTGDDPDDVSLEDLAEVNDASSEEEKKSAQETIDIDAIDVAQALASARESSPDEDSETKSTEEAKADEEPPAS
jgi:hypothetical protein